MDHDSWTETQLNGLGDGSFARKPYEYKSLFRFVGLRTDGSWKLFEKTLETGRLLGATAVSLNDPFELEPILLDDVSKKNVLAAQNAISRLKIAKEESDIDDLAKYRLLAKEYVEQVKNYYRIVAFSERMDSPLLWSHYANSYKGICFHFLTQGFKRNPWPFGYVEYSKVRPFYPLSLALKIKLNERRSDDRILALKRQSEKMFFFTKSLDWQYEDEIRSVYNSNIEDGLRYDKESLVSIIVGPKMPESDISRLSDLVKKHSSHTTIKRAILSQSTFSVDIQG